MSLHTTAATRFDSFNLYRTSYKNIGAHEIEVNVLVPKSSVVGKRPVMVKWHGGGLTTGTAAYPDWFSAFLVPFLHRNNAIAVLPNYRLTPEHTGDEILEDIADFWTWFKSSLPAYIASNEANVEIDFTKVLVNGDSAGAWCALQSIFILPQSSIQACLLHYPVTNLFPTSPDDKPFGQSIPSEEVLNEFLAKIVPGNVMSGAVPPERSWIAPMLRAHLRWEECFGKGKHLMPDTRLDDAKFFVPTYIIHGKDDSVVPVKWTHAFVDKAQTLFPDVPIKAVTPSGDHGLDINIYEEDEEWLRDFVRRVEKDWLA